jgi:serralysin
MHIESLEVRRLFALVPISIDGDTVIITATRGDDTITVNKFEDRFNVIVNTTAQQAFMPGIDRVKIIAKKGDDTITVDSQGDDAILFPVRIEAGPGDDSIQGGPRADRILCGTGKDTAYGNGGNDTILGQDGADELFGGTANDRLEGGAGGDSLDSDPVHRDGNDRLLGQGGPDELFGNSDDTLRGGKGVDDVVEE